METKHDKNLQNTVEDLEQTPVNSHQAQQMQQEQNDRRKEMISNDDGYKESEKTSY